MPATDRSMGIGPLKCTAALLAGALFLGGCGQKGPLFMAPAAVASTAPAPAEPATIEQKQPAQR